MANAYLRDYKNIYSGADVTILNGTFQVEAGDRVLLYVFGRKATSEEQWAWTYTEVTINGVTGSLLTSEIVWAQNSRNWKARVYGFNSLPQGNHTVVIKVNSNHVRLAAYVCAYQDSLGFGAAAGVTNVPESEATITVPLTLPFSLLSVVGITRTSSNLEAEFTFSEPTFLTHEFTDGLTSSSLGIGAALAHGYIGASGSQDVTVEAESGTNSMGVLAVEVMSGGQFKAEAKISTTAPPLLTPSTAQIGTTLPVILIGSIPPVQVMWQGNLYFSTRERVVNVMTLFTKGDYWVQPAGEAAQTNTVSLKRRKAYLVPR